jgi:hypothetical protein
MTNLYRFPNSGKARTFSLFQLMRADEQRERILQLIDSRLPETTVSTLTGWSLEAIRRCVAERNQSPPEAA